MIKIFKTFMDYRRISYDIQFSVWSRINHPYFTEEKIWITEMSTKLPKVTVITQMQTLN